MAKTAFGPDGRLTQSPYYKRGAFSVKIVHSPLREAPSAAPWWESKGCRPRRLDLSDARETSHGPLLSQSAVGRRHGRAELRRIDRIMASLAMAEKASRWCGRISMRIWPPWPSSMQGAACKMMSGITVGSLDRCVCPDCVALSSPVSYRPLTLVPTVRRMDAFDWLMSTSCWRL
jgi:hypothetical protein